MASVDDSGYHQHQLPDFSGYGLHSTGGRFNFDTYEIDSGFLDNPLFVFHEQEHNGFVRGTIFGWVQHVAESLHRDSGSRDLAAFKWTLWQASEKTHERGATFCSIKAFPIERNRELVGELPDAYGGFYEDMAAIVDQAFSSSYMQYAFGKAITNHALNPCLDKFLLKLQSSAQLRDLHLTADLSPDMRWDQITDAINTAGLCEFAQRTYVVMDACRESIGLALSGPVDQEETWSTLNATDATALDKCVYRALLVVLREMVTQVPAVDPERFDEAQREATATLGRLAGKTLTLRRPSASETAGTQANLKAEIRNDQTIDTRRIHKLAHGDLVRYWLSGNGPRKAVSMLGVDNLNSSEWLIELATGQAAVLARASYANYREVLAMRARLALIGSPIAELPTMARINDPRRFADLYNQLASFFVIKLQDGVLDLISHNVHWYIAGDLRAWWHELREYGPVRVLPLVPLPAVGAANMKPFESKEEAHRSRELMEDRSLGDPIYSHLSGGRSLLVCEFDQLTGRFVRAFPPYAMQGFFEVIGDEFDIFAVGDRKAVAEGASSLFSLAERVWATF